ncbi:hypothetical protein [Geopsychrobacter electrodiphilus]|uniref:hypothetical protein n=1 Tax=Geopsychrobacter electrodiphilus TaxID=225196 RepID=UPI00037D4117|nr:hypothetical protein [Geopsychrobacter electrodiphilus]
MSHKAKVFGYLYVVFLLLVFCWTGDSDYQDAKRMQSTGAQGYRVHNLRGE